MKSFVIHRRRTSSSIEIRYSKFWRSVEEKTCSRSVSHSKPSMFATCNVSSGPTR